MLKLSLLLATFLIAGSAWASEALLEKGWLLTTTFPAPPALHEPPPIAGVKYVAEAAVTKEGEGFAIHRIVPLATGAPDDLDRLYQTQKKTMLSARPSVLLEEEKITIDGLPALRWVLSYKNGARQVEFRDVLVKAATGYEGYLLLNDYDAKSPRSPAARAFFGNIKLVTPLAAGETGK